MFSLHRILSLLIACAATPAWAQRAPEPDVQVTEKEVKSFEGDEARSGRQSVSAGLEAIRGRIVDEVTVVSSGATTKLLIDPGSGESNRSQTPRNRSSAALSAPFRTRMIRLHTMGRVADRRDGDPALRSAIGFASLDHAIFPKISLRHRNFFLCRIAP